MVGSIIAAMFAMFVIAALLAIHHVVSERDSDPTTRPE